jgi:uncharacterized membrane protein
LHISLRTAAFLLGFVPVCGALADFSAAQVAPQTSAQTKKTPAGPAAPQSTHFPILLLAFGPASGNEPAWSVRIGQKGPERLDRPGYPPAMFDPVDVNREGTTEAWTYRAKDSATGADVTVHLTRESCSAELDGSGTKYTFRAIFEHSQLGTLNGCARIATELFPKIANQTSGDDDDVDPKKPPPPLPADIIKFKSPVDFAYLSSTHQVVVTVGKLKKIAAPAGSELALSHDGKRLLYTRDDSKSGPERTIVLYDFTTGRSKDLVHGTVRQAFWSPDDSRIAFLNFQENEWQIWTLPSATLDNAAPLYKNSVNSLHGWIDPRTLLASDMQNAYWITDEGILAQTVPLKDIYGPSFQIMSSDTLRLNPINPDLLMVSANYEKPPAGAPTDANDTAAGIFFYELRSKRRTVLSDTDQWANGAEWSRDGVQVFYTHRDSPRASLASSIYKVLWDGLDPKRYIPGSDFVVGQ